jgi:hypothetical protein
MVKKSQSDREKAARALCRVAGLPEHTTHEGNPMWMSFLPEADAVLAPIGWNPKTYIRAERIEHQISADASSIWSASSFFGFAFSCSRASRPLASDTSTRHSLLQTTIQHWENTSRIR